MRTNKCLWLLGLLPLLAGCGVTIQNYTPQAMTRNPSGLYVVTVEVTRNDNSVVDGSLKPFLVLPDKTVPMVPRADLHNRWEYTMAVQPGATNWPYYFKVDFMTEKLLGKRKPRTQFDPPDAPKHVYQLYLSDKTGVSLDARRGRVGSVIKVLGRGFLQGDQVLLGGQAVPTRLENANTLSFTIPAMAGNKVYPVEVSGSGRTEKLKLGDLLVDETPIVVTPAELDVPFDAWASLDVAIPQPAPPGGLAVRVESTDATLLEVAKAFTIPEGQFRVVMKIKGSHVGSGILTLAAEGFTSTPVPFHVVVPK